MAVAASSSSAVAFPDEVLEYVLKFVSASKDRNAVSLVCKAWFRAEGYSRESVVIGNCYSVSPQALLRRFPRLKSVTLKGKPRFADFGLVPPGWGAHALPWITSLATSSHHVALEELRLKRMCISDEALLTIAHSFPNFRALACTCCDGFSTHGLAAIASRCRQLRELNLEECEIEDRGSDWLRCFPETCNSLVTLNIAYLAASGDFEALERLVVRCSATLRSLQLSRDVSLTQMQRLLVAAPHLTDLGTGSYCQQLKYQQYRDLQAGLIGCTRLTSLSGFWDFAPVLLRSLYIVCPNLTSLNLSYVAISSSYFCNLIACCPKLQRLWVQDSVEDKGLQQVAEHCSELRELRVFPQDPRSAGCVTDAGLVAISQRCRNLSSVLYFCKQCSNAAIATVAKNCPNLIRFRLCIITPRLPDYVTGEPMDEAFGAIVRECTNLRRLAVSGLLTNRAFELIGTYGKKLETLSVAFAGESDVAMQYVLQGCPNLRKLEIRDSPFGDYALLSGIDRYPSMRFLWMSNCKVTLYGCGMLAQALPSLNVEVVREDADDNLHYDVATLYVYRSLVGPRHDSARIMTLPSTVLDT